MRRATHSAEGHGAEGHSAEGRGAWCGGAWRVGRWRPAQARGSGGARLLGLLLDLLDQRDAALLGQLRLRGRGRVRCGCGGGGEHRLPALARALVGRALLGVLGAHDEPLQLVGEEVTLEPGWGQGSG